MVLRQYRIIRLLMGLLLIGDMLLEWLLMVKGRIIRLMASLRRKS
jgi:hypothetical protein